MNLSAPYVARVNEIADSSESGGTKMLLQVFACFDEVLVHDVFSRPRDEWAAALRELHMPRIADLIEASQVAAERRCVLCNPGSPEEIRQREEASAELDRLIVDDNEDLPQGVHRERDGFLVMERNGPPPNLDDYGPPIVIAPQPDEPVADVKAAFEAGEKGVTKRRVSATAIRQALYASLAPNFEIDSDGYDDAAVAVALLIEAGTPTTEGQERSEESA